MFSSRTSLQISVALLLTVITQTAVAQNEAPGFDAILDEATRATFEKVSTYVAANPEAGDVERAYRWLLATSLEHQLESEALPIATAYAERAGADPATKGIADQVITFGLAKSGKVDEAVQRFSAQLRFARFQSGGALIEFGRRLATQLQMVRDFAAARAVYRAIADKFFLNVDVRRLCENKIAKIDLIGQAAPEFGVADSAGDTVELTTLQGKVVLIDFWATNCPPCIAEMPNLKQLYSEYQDDGFEIVGVSLDADNGIVEQFTDRADIPWRMVVDKADVDGLRQQYLVPTIPALYIVDKVGRIHQFDVRGHDLRATVESLLFPSAE